MAGEVAVPVVLVQLVAVRSSSRADAEAVEGRGTVWEAQLEDVLEAVLRKPQACLVCLVVPWSSAPSSFPPCLHPEQMQKCSGHSEAWPVAFPSVWPPLVVAPHLVALGAAPPRASFLHVRWLDQAWHLERLEFDSLDLLWRAAIPCPSPSFWPLHHQLWTARAVSRPQESDWQGVVILQHWLQICYWKHLEPPVPWHLMNPSDSCCLFGVALAAVLLEADFSTPEPLAAALLLPELGSPAVGADVANAVANAVAAIAAIVAVVAIVLAAAAAAP